MVKNAGFSATRRIELAEELLQLAKARHEAELKMLRQQKDEAMRDRVQEIKGAIRILEKKLTLSLEEEERAAISKSIRDFSSEKFGLEMVLYQVC
ncbi:MAG TPA: hypothetical protein VF817_03075 [Patescibacteria group bacterium]